MSGSHKLIQIAFYVSLFVIIGLAITFTVLFALYALYKRKHIRNSHEDEKLLTDLKKRYRRELEGDPEYQLEQGKEKKHSKRKKEQPLDLYSCLEDNGGKVSLVSLIKRDEEKARRRKRVGEVFSYCLYGVFFIFFGVVTAFKINGDSFYFGNVSYLVIQTGSMETANSKNEYLAKNGLDNQIPQFSLIGIEQINQEDIKLYDVLAYKNASNEIIVHRVININVKDGTTYYTFRGDSNSISDISETALTFDKIQGRYNGFNNFGLGVATTYFKSSAGLVAVASAAFFLFSFDVSEDSIDKEYRERILEVAKKYDEERK